jgi:hypothetical protein
MKKVFVWFVQPFYDYDTLQYRTERHEFIVRIVWRVAVVCAFVAAIQYLLDIAVCPKGTNLFYN